MGEPVVVGAGVVGSLLVATGLGERLSLGGSDTGLAVEDKLVVDVGLGEAKGSVELLGRQRQSSGSGLDGDVDSSGNVAGLELLGLSHVNEDHVVVIALEDVVGQSLDVGVGELSALRGQSGISSLEQLSVEVVGHGGQSNSGGVELRDGMDLSGGDGVDNGSQSSASDAKGMLGGVSSNHLSGNGCNSSEHHVVRMHGTNKLVLCGLLLQDTMYWKTLILKIAGRRGLCVDWDWTRQKLLVLGGGFSGGSEQQLWGGGKTRVYNTRDIISRVNFTSPPLPLYSYILRDSCLESGQ